MNLLVDTNIFLEILLNQPASPKCEFFLRSEPGAAWISDFSLHSIGVLLFRRGGAELFGKFVADALPSMTVLSLSAPGYLDLIKAKNQFGLDFDDAYQFCVARENNLAIATQDKDFQRVKNAVQIHFV